MSISLPHREAPTGRPAAPKVTRLVAPPVTVPPLVLVADVDAVAREAVADRLIADGYRVISASDGHQVVRLAALQELDLVIADAALPALDGRAVCRELASHGPIAPPVLVITSTTTSAERVSLLDAGALDSFAKPFDLDELTARVRVAIRTKRMVDELMESAATDPLTGLPNRRQIDARVIEAVALAERQARPLACLMIDLDDFKAINDTYGHAAGDAVLREVARRLREGIRASDVVGRYGGEEFLMLLPDTDAAGALTLAEKLRAHLAADPFPLPPTVGVAASTGADTSRSVPVTASIGASCWERRMVEPEELPAAADGALYRAKALGRDRVVFAARIPTPPAGSLTRSAAA
jgi:diguanylate cyclase (GGDEF)-like protein